MRKIDTDMYMYKNVVVHKLSNGNYECEVNVNDLALPIKVVGSSISSFKRIFNEVVLENGGLK